MHDLQLARETQSSFESWRSQGGAATAPAGCDIAVSVRVVISCCIAPITTLPSVVAAILSGCFFLVACAGLGCAGLRMYE